jgi:cellobiose epimerase
MPPEPAISARLNALAGFAETELTIRILPFWAGLQDKERGGFFGQADYAGIPDPAAPKGTVLHARILWTFATAGARYRRPDWLAPAEAAYRFLAEVLHDDARGGLCWTVGADGGAADDRKHIYAQAFGIYGLSAYYAATADAQALRLAQSLFRTIEARAADQFYGGYFESFGAAWEVLPNDLMGMAQAPKTVNTHLHLLEAYAALWAVWPDPVLRGRIEALLTLLTGLAFDRQANGFGQFFQANWRGFPAGRSFGHDIEGSWLIAQAAEALGGAIAGRVREALSGVAETVRLQALDRYGGVIDGVGIDGKPDRRKIWWVQTEAAVGFLDAFEQTGEVRFLDATEAVWRFIDQVLIDREHGEWLSEGTGAERLPKASIWKCPYHNGRACLETMARVARMLGR